MKEKLTHYLVTIRSFFTKIWLFVKRVYKREGPHSKHCKCSKWGIYTDMKCPNPGRKLIVRGGGLVKR